MSTATESKLTNMAQPKSTFSYAQAAKSTPSSNATQLSRRASGTNQDSESRRSSKDATTTNVEDGQVAIPTLEKLKMEENKSHDSGLTSPSSPDFGASSTSTLLREDDSSSTPQAPSETTTWENKSQVSSQDKTATDNKTESQDTEETTKEEPVPEKKVLKEAPVPTVNIWTQRAEQQKSRQVTQAPGNKRGADSRSHTGADVSHKGLVSTRYNNEPRGKREAGEGTARKPRRASNPGVSSEQRLSHASMTAPIPSMGDSESWPTPLIARAEDSRRTQVKSDKDRAAPAPSHLNGKKTDWVTVPINPTVVFNTPINTGARRGGRGGARGGREGGRGGLTNGVRHGAAQTNGDISHSADGEKAGASVEPSAGQTSSHTSSPPAAQNQQGTLPGSETESSEIKPSAVEAQEFVPGATRTEMNASNEEVNGSPVKNAFKSKAARRQEANLESGEKQRSLETDGQESARPHVRKSSVSPQQTADYHKPKLDPSFEAFSPRHQDGDRRHSQYTPFSNSERGSRGRGRGRGGPSHGFHSAQPPQAYTNGYAANGSYAPTRSFRGSSRAHSIATESMYGGHMANGYAPSFVPQQAANMMPEYAPVFQMSAVGYDQYGQYPMIGVVVAQMDYYFSINNLVKDMFLRKHMDGQGFILLSFISSFNRLKAICQDFEMIKMACMQSNLIDYRVGVDGRDRVRKATEWEQWVLPAAERDPSARNDAPVEFRQPQIQQMGYSPMAYPGRQASLPAQSYQMSAPYYQPMYMPYAQSNGYPETNGYALHQLSATAQPHVSGFASAPSDGTPSPAIEQGAFKSAGKIKHSEVISSESAVKELNPANQDSAQVSPGNVNGEKTDPMETAAAPVEVNGLTNGHID